MPVLGHSLRCQSSPPLALSSAANGMWYGLTLPGNAPDSATAFCESTLRPGSARIGPRETLHNALPLASSLATKPAVAHHTSSGQVPGRRLSGPAPKSTLPANTPL